MSTNAATFYRRDDLIAFLTEALTEQVAKVAEQARSNAGWSSTIPGAIYVDYVQNLGDYLTCDIVVDLNDAPSARAFEYGSGLHSTEGTPEKYKIAPVNADRLAFPIERWPNYEPPPNVSVAVFPGPISWKGYVMHPGVEAKPYLRPAIEDTKLDLRRRLGRAYKVGVVQSAPRVVFIEIEGKA